MTCVRCDTLADPEKSVIGKPMNCQSLETDFDDVDLKELKDIRKIRIDRNHTKEKRIAQYLRQVGNPYLVCIGNVKVKIRFANNGVSFEDAFEELLLSV